MSLTSYLPGRRIAPLITLATLIGASAAAGFIATPGDVRASTMQPCTSVFPASTPPQVSGVYQVSEPEHLSWILKPVSDSDPTIPQLAADYVQTADIDLSGCLWTPLDGVAVEAVQADPRRGIVGVEGVEGFAGSYDGGGFQISELTINASSLPSSTQNENTIEEYELFQDVGFIGYLNGGTLKNVTLTRPQLGFTLGEIHRATLENSGLAVGRAEGATVRKVTVEDGTISIDCEVTNPASALCDVTAVGGVVGASVTSTSTLESLTASVTITATSSDAPPDPNTLEEPIVVGIEPSEIDLTYVGGIVGIDEAASSLSTLSARGSMALDFPKVSELGGVAGHLSGSDLSRSLSEMDITLTHPRLLPSNSLSGGFHRVGGLVGFMTSDATVAYARSGGALNLQLEVLHLTDDPVNDPQGRCRDTTDGERWLDTIETWEFSTRGVCSPAQAVAEIGGLVGSVNDPSTAGPSVTSTFNRTRLTLAVNESTTVDNPHPELIIGSVGSTIGSVFQDQYTENHRVMSTGYSAGTLGLNIADSLNANEGVLVSGGVNSLDQPGSIVGSWNPANHSVTADTFVDNAAYASITARGGTVVSTAQMVTTALYAEDGWPIVEGYAPFNQGQTEWGRCSGVNDGYPFLLWEYSANPCAVTASPTTRSPSGDTSDAAFPTQTESGAPLSNLTPIPQNETVVAEDFGSAGEQNPGGPSAQPEAFPQQPPVSTNPSGSPRNSSAPISMWSLALVALGGLGVIGVAVAVWLSSSASSGSSGGILRGK